MVNEQLHAYLICSLVPPEVAFVIAHAASFRVLKSADANICTKQGIILLSIMACEEKSKQNLLNSRATKTLTDTEVMQNFKKKMKIT